MAHKWAISSFQMVKTGFCEELLYARTPQTNSESQNPENQILTFSNLMILEGLKNVSLRFKTSS